MDLEKLLTDRLAPAFAAVAGVPVDPVVRRSQRADFQSDAALALARRLGRPPRTIAAGGAGARGAGRPVLGRRRSPARASST